MLVWIIDDEWNDYKIEYDMLRENFNDIEIVISKKEFMQKALEVGKYIDGIICQVNVPITEKLLDLLPNCKGISVYGSGYENIDLLGCSKRNIVVTNVRNYCNEDIADYTLAAIFYSYKQLAQHSEKLKNNLKHNKWGADTIIKPPNRISSQVLFVVGFGNIGKTVAEKAGLLGLEIIAYDEYLSNNQIIAGGATPVSWEEGFRKADYISVNLLGVEENRNKIGKNELCMMKKSAIIINTSRGLIINEDDLLEVIKEKKIAGAILDVLNSEPPDINNPILSQDNILVTPHISYASTESLTALRALATQNMIDILLSKDLKMRIV